MMITDQRWMREQWRESWAQPTMRIATKWCVGRIKLVGEDEGQSKAQVDLGVLRTA